VIKEWGTAIVLLVTTPRRRRAASRLGGR